MLNNFEIVNFPLSLSVLALHLGAVASVDKNPLRRFLDQNLDITIGFPVVDLPRFGFFPASPRSLEALVADVWNGVWF
jgi:hypothetical protein